LLKTVFKNTFNLQNSKKYNEFIFKLLPAVN
jgi:hypothetical protein